MKTYEDSSILFEYLNQRTLRDGRSIKVPRILDVACQESGGGSQPAVQKGSLESLLVCQVSDGLIRPKLSVNKFAVEDTQGVHENSCVAYSKKRFPNRIGISSVGRVRPEIVFEWYRGKVAVVWERLHDPYPGL